MYKCSTKIVLRNLIIIYLLLTIMNEDLKYVQHK